MRPPERADSRRTNHVAPWISGISVLPRRLALGSRLWRYLRPPEKADSGRRNHVSPWISAQPATPSISRSDGLTVKSVSQLVSRSVNQYLWSGRVRVVSASVNRCQSASVGKGQSSTPSGSEAVSYQPPPVSVHSSLSLAPSVSPDSVHGQSAQDHVDTRSVYL